MCPEKSSEFGGLSELSVDELTDLNCNRREWCKLCAQNLNVNCEKIQIIFGESIIFWVGIQKWGTVGKRIFAKYTIYGGSVQKLVSMATKYHGNRGFAIHSNQWEMQKTHSNSQPINNKNTAVAEQE